MMPETSMLYKRLYHNEAEARYPQLMPAVLSGGYKVKGIIDPSKGRRCFSLPTSVLDINGDPTTGR